MKITINILCILCVLVLTLCSTSSHRNDTSNVSEITSNTPTHKLKIKGVSFVSMDKIATVSDFRDAKTNSNCEWVSLMPFGFNGKGGHTIQYNSNRQWKGETISGISKYIDSARSEGLNICLKPQVWLWSDFTGDFTCSSENEWMEFEESYYNFIFDYCELAESRNVEMFCIGTEWKSFISERPLFWNRLIDSVRSNYSGIITYASNWDNYDRVPFWDKLNCIGIDAYFPLSDKKSATMKQLKSRFEHLNKELKAFSEKYSRQIVFTEYGWRSAPGMLQEPWNSNHTQEVDLSIQTKIYEAFYQTTWNESWFGGGFIWKWFPDHQSMGGQTNNRFTPQNKPVQEVIKRQYAS